MSAASYSPAQCAAPRLLGDTDRPACASLCSKDRPFSCGLCTCASCSFCSASSQHHLFAQAFVDRQRDGLSDDPGPSRRLLELLQRRFKQPHGIAVRTLECSLPQCLGNMSFSVGSYGAPCIVHALAGKKAPVSVLRWDLPATIYYNGRCLEDSPSGGVVKSSGIGLILCNAESERGGLSKSGSPDNGPYTFHEDVAFAHDAWTPKHTEVRTNPIIRLSLCAAGGQPGASHSAYAAARFQGTLHRMRAPELHQDGAYINRFINSTWNCFWSRTGWEHAFDDQRAFALLLAERQDQAARESAGRAADALREVFGPGGESSEGWAGGKAGTWGALYNQVHFSYGPADVCGVFYVNSTLERRHRHRLLQLVGLSADVEARSAAAREASKARQLASLAARLISSLTRPVPVLQLRIGEDSIEPARVRERVAGGPAAADVHELFDEPPELPAADLLPVPTLAASTESNAVEDRASHQSALSTFDRPPCSDVPPQLVSSAWPAELNVSAVPASCSDVLRLGLCQRDMLMLCSKTCGRCSAIERATRIPRKAFVFWGKEGSTSAAGGRQGRYSASNVARGAWLVCSMLGVLCHHQPGTYLKRPGELGHEEDLKRCTNASALTIAKLRQGRGMQEAGVSIAYVSLMQKIVARCHAPETLGLSEPSCEPVLVFEDDVALPADVSPAKARELMVQALDGPGAMLNETIGHTTVRTPADYVQVGWCSKACSHAFQITVRGASSVLRHVERYPPCMWGIPDDPSHPDHQEMWSIDDRLHYLCRKHVMRCTNGHHIDIDLRNTDDTEAKGLIKQRKASSDGRTRRLPARIEVPIA